MVNADTFGFFLCAEKLQQLQGPTLLAKEDWGFVIDRKSLKGSSLKKQIPEAPDRNKRMVDD